MTAQLTPTEIEELNIAIAEDCGRKRKGIEFVKDNIKAFFPPVFCERTLPPYTTSIDAIQKAAMERFKDEIEVSAFAVELYRIMEETDSTNWRLWQLTSLDWCIAFARTAKIWRYKV